MDSGGQEHSKVVLDTRAPGRGGRQLAFKLKVVAVMVLLAAIPTLVFFQMAVNTVAYLVGDAPTLTFVARSNYNYCDKNECHVATHGITEPGGQAYDWPFEVKPGAKFQFPGPLIGPFWPNFNQARPVTHRSKQVILFAGLILGYATLTGVTAAMIRQMIEVDEGEEWPWI